MSTDGGLIPALVQMGSDIAIGVGLSMTFLPVQLLSIEAALVAIAALTLALIGGACIGSCACRIALDTAYLTTGVCGSCRLGFSGAKQGIRHVNAEMTVPVLRRFRSARRCISLCSLSFVRCAQ
ncbi:MULTISPECIES: hypothetical protein [unclassified Sulfitobacter]|uniref:hypothetical protein n=1 Tax=unclassified Sulfitobacter TaxID=196795 RepID=UPI002AC9EF74|nr:hypothetical protein [Sulfitobacter sp. OXR-159]WPZ31786.1 hypothetical protein T8A63_20075 [Sulfitobacter sp. OXR-159]